MGSGRDAALEALTACRRLDAWSDGSMKAACRGLDRREAALCARLGMDIRDSVAAGDENNDVSMLRAAGVGAAMSNAVPAAKAAADYVTERDNNHDGIEEVIREFLL